MWKLIRDPYVQLVYTWQARYTSKFFCCNDDDDDDSM